MGLVIMEVLFEGSAPGLSRIAEALESRSGLKVKSGTRKGDELSALYDVNGSVAFECDPAHTIEVTAYHPGAVKRDMEEELGEYTPAMPPVFYRATMGYEEPPGKQTVYLMDHAALEPTLLHYLMLALEDLGGKFTHPLSEEGRATCARQLTPLELRHRQLKSLEVSLPLLIIGGLVFPFTVAFGASGIDSSRGRLNENIRHVHQRWGQTGKPPQIGRVRYLLMRAFEVMGRLLLFFPAAIGALIYLVLVPIYFVFAWLRFILLKRKLARLGD
jgi:hypothetical protein